MLNISSLSKFQVYNTIWLTIATIVYFRSSELIYNLKMYTLWPTSLHIPHPPASGNYHFTLCFCELNFFFKDSIYKWYYIVFVFLCLACFTWHKALVSSMLLRIVRFPSLFWLNNIPLHNTCILKNLFIHIWALRLFPYLGNC